MESLTPFIRHELEDAPGPSGPPEETSSVVSPPLGVGTRSAARHGTAKAGSRLPAAAVAAGRPGCAAPAAGSPAASSGLRHPHDRRNPGGLSAEERRRVSGRAVAGGHDPVRAGTVWPPAAHQKPPPGAGGGRKRRFTAGRVARRSALRLKEM